MRARRLLTAGFLTLLLGWTFHQIWHPTASKTTTALGPSVTAAEVPAFVRALRPSYPYSVVPGGVYSSQELQDAIRRDPVVQQHYRSFRAETVRLVKLGEDQVRYVSYRKGDQILWTHKQLRIPRGELVLTDGSHIARARCGNQLSVEQPAGMPGPPSLDRSSTEPLGDLAMPALSLPMLRDKRILFATPPDLGESPQGQPQLLALLPYLLIPSPVGPNTRTLFDDAAPSFGPTVPIATPYPIVGPYGLRSFGSGGEKPSPISPVLSPVAVLPLPAAAAIPEPAMLGLWGLGLLTIAAVLRHKATVPRAKGDGTGPPQ